MRTKHVFRNIVLTAVIQGKFNADKVGKFQKLRLNKTFKIKKTNSAGEKSEKYCLALSICDNMVDVKSGNYYQSLAKQ